MPETTATTPTTKDISALVRDAAYVVVGLGVIGFQKAQVRRVELQKQLQEQGDLRDQLTKVAKELEERIEPLVELVDERLDVVQERLPEQVRDVVVQARKTVKETAQQVRTQLVGSDA